MTTAMRYHDTPLNNDHPGEGQGGPAAEGGAGQAVPRREGEDAGRAEGLRGRALPPIAGRQGMDLSDKLI